MFKRFEPINKPVRFEFEGRPVTAQHGDSVAAALLSEDIISFRATDKSNTSRGPFCMIGNCFECLVEIDGIPNQQACRQQVKEGMRVRRQYGLRGTGVGDES